MFSRSDGRGFCSSDEETDDAEPLDHDYNLPQVKGKKVVNRGKWTKEEVNVRQSPKEFDFLIRCIGDNFATHSFNL